MKNPKCVCEISLFLFFFFARLLTHTWTHEIGLPRITHINALLVSHDTALPPFTFSGSFPEYRMAQMFLMQYL